MRVYEEPLVIHNGPRPRGFFELLWLELRLLELLLLLLELRRRWDELRRRDKGLLLRL